MRERRGAQPTTTFTTSGSSCSSSSSRCNRRNSNILLLLGSICAAQLVHVLKEEITSALRIVRTFRLGTSKEVLNIGKHSTVVSCGRASCINSIRGIAAPHRAGSIISTAAICITGSTSSIRRTIILFPPLHLVKRFFKMLPSRKGAFPCIHNILLLLIICYG